jgi:prepilin-type processing-associated H-X9-DG protein
MRASHLPHGTGAWIAGRVVVGLVCVVALSIVGFVGGLLTGPHILPDLDIDVYVCEPRTRVYCWAFLCALAIGLVAAAVLLAMADDDRMFNSSPRRRNHTGLTLLVGLLMLVSLPALFAWAAAFSLHESTNRAHCQSSLKQIALAIHSYHDEFGCLPPAYVSDDNGRPKHSWRVLILPYLIKNEVPGSGETKHIYESYDFSEPWDGPQNRHLASRMPLVFGCAGDPGRRASNTSYLLITGEHAAFPVGRSVKLDNIRDGKANTILVVEAGNSGINWMEPKDYPIDQLRFGQKDTPGLKMGGNHPGGANAAFADGSVRFLHEKGGTNAMLKELGTIDGGEKVDLDRW